MKYQAIEVVENSIKNNKVETAVMFTKDGVYLGSAKGTENKVDLSELSEYTKNAILTHNHPAGSSFSMEDIRYMLVNELSEIRVVTSKNTFSLVRSGKVVNVNEELVKLQSKIPGIEKELKSEIKESIINDTELTFEDAELELVKRMFDGEVGYTYRVV